MSKDKKLKLSRRTWAINPETRVVPSSKIYKKKDRQFDYKDYLDEEVGEVDQEKDQHRKD